MMYLILTLLVYQAESKYFLTEHEEGPVKHHLLTIQDPADTPVTKDHPKIGEGSSNPQSGQVRSGQVRSGQVRSGQVSSGQINSVQSSPVQFS